MDKKLVISRNMNRDVKNTAKSFRNKDLVNEKHYASGVSAKQYHVSHNHFQRTPHKNYQNKKSDYFRSETVSLSNEEYIHANSQIWLNQECLKSNYDYNDIHSQWESIIQINFYTNEEIFCPICLDIPTISRTDKCGHVYCFPCLNKFLSYDDGFYKKCALCSQEIDPKRVKRASFIPRFSLKVGDTISMLLMKRNKSESFPVPINVNHANLPCVYSNESRFSNVAVCSNSDLLNIIQVEILSLEDQLVDAIREESDRTNSISLALDSVKNEYSLTSYLPECVKRNDIEILALQSKDLNEIMRDYNVYYQMEDGSSVFMCPLNWKCMTHEFIDQAQCLPLRISGEIVEIERYTITHEFLNRYRYLKYLPIGSSVSFVEIDMSNIVSELTLTKYDREIRQRNDNRSHQKKLDQVLTNKKIKHENSFNESHGYLCLNSLMKETDTILDEDFVPLCAPVTPPASENAASKPTDEKKLSFADMMHPKKSLSIFTPMSLPVQEEAQSRGFSLQDCVITKNPKNKKNRKK